MGEGQGRMGGERESEEMIVEKKSRSISTKACGGTGYRTGMTPLSDTLPTALRCTVLKII